MLSVHMATCGHEKMAVLRPQHVGLRGVGTGGISQKAE